MNWRKSIGAGAMLALAMFIAGGCWHSDTQDTNITPPEQYNPQNQFMPVAAADVKDMTQRLAAFDARAYQLPGNGEVAYRALMEVNFADLMALLPVLEGPDPDGGFRQQIHLIQTYRDQLIGLSFDTTGESIIASGMRAAYTALEAIYSRQFADAADLGKSMDDLGGKLDELDTSHGDAAKTTVAQSVKMVGTIMGQMNTLKNQYQVAKSAAAATTTSPTETTAPSGTMP